jgi:hypothetical protein
MNWISNFRSGETKVSLRYIVANFTKVEASTMRRTCVCGPGVFAICILVSTVAFASKVNTADYPLRVHIVDRNGVRHYHGFGGGLSDLEAVDGMGQANLFENGQPLGFDFTYQCGQPITHQSTYETFMARWKKPGRSIEIIQPIIGGKPGDMSSCELKVTMKQNTIYLYRNGGLGEEPSAKFKEWMAAHQYDPEHGNNEPVNTEPAKPAAASAPTN